MDDVTDATAPAPAPRLSLQQDIGTLHPMLVVDTERDRREYPVLEVLTVNDHDKGQGAGLLIKTTAKVVLVANSGGRYKQYIGPQHFGPQHV